VGKPITAWLHLDQEEHHESTYHTYSDDHDDAKLMLGLAPDNAVGQEKQHASYKTSSENTEVHATNVDVGDVPNHVVRVFDVHRTHRNGPMINGVRLVEEFARGMTDVTDSNGTSVGYGVYVMENGDRFFARFTQVNKNSSGKIAASGVGPITGGTGKLADIHGVVQFVVNFDLKSGFNEQQTDIDYTIGK
jgi:hypothetical protein